MTVSDFSPTGWVAYYDPSVTPSVRRAVESWDAEGVALVVDDRRGQLVPAREQPGFRELIEVSRVVAAVPAAPGWSVQADDGSWDAPIALWIVDQRGMVAPVPGLSEPYLEAEVGVSTKVRPPD